MTLRRNLIYPASGSAVLRRRGVGGTRELGSVPERGTNHRENRRRSDKMRQSPNAAVSTPIQVGSTVVASDALSSLTQFLFSLPRNPRGPARHPRNITESLAPSSY